jgi:hypothetical protein
MLGPLFIFSLLAVVCAGALFRPAIGVIGYYAFIALEPEWNWRWSLPADFQYQKYIAAATLIGLLVTGLRGNRWSSSARLACACLMAFFALALLSAQFTILPDATAFYLDIVGKIILMAVVAVHVIDSPRLLTRSVWVIIASQAYNAFQINLDYFKMGFCAYAHYTSWGLKGDNNDYSIFTTPIMALSCAVMFGIRSLPLKLIAGVIFTLQLHQIMLLESRGCMLGGLAMMPIFLWFMPKTKLNWSAVLVAVALGGTLAGPSVVKEFSSSFASDENRDASAESRFDLWRAGAQITADYPLLGVGPWAGQGLVPSYLGMDTGRKGLHNLIFEISTGCGVPALLLYLSYFAIAWFVAIRALRRRKVAPLPEWAEIIYLGTAAGLVGYFVSSMFSAVAMLESSYMLAAFSLATSLMVARLRRSEARAAMAERHLESSIDTYEDDEVELLQPV